MANVKYGSFTLADTETDTEKTYTEPIGIYTGLDLALM